MTIPFLFQMDRFGHFKLWHAGGSILVAISFSSVFGSCVPCKLMGTNSSTLETVGYSTFAAIFNVGWAVTQVAHMYWLFFPYFSPCFSMVSALHLWISFICS
jgi:hypothetical protein